MKAEGASGLVKIEKKSGRGEGVSGGSVLWFVENLGSGSLIAI